MSTPIKPFGDDLRLANSLREELTHAAAQLLERSGMGEAAVVCRYAETVAVCLTAVETRLLRKNLDTPAPPIIGRVARQAEIAGRLSEDDD